MPFLRRLLQGAALFSLPALVRASTECPGYHATNVIQSGANITASLTLAGPACNTYGTDIENLTLEVIYDTKNRLHVKIFDTAEQVNQIPASLLPPPPIDHTINPLDAALSFSMVQKPFSFTIRRALTNEILFDTTGTPLVFQSQYVFLETSLPLNPNLYGLGEHTDPFRLNSTNYVRTFWNSDSGGVPLGYNLYGSHPVYFDHRTTGTHAVLMFNSNGMAINIDTPSPNEQILAYNMLGGVIDLYFMAGPTPIEVAQQYSDVTGKSAMMPYWGLGFHQCSYNMPDVIWVAEVVANYSANNIPLQTMWTDIDYMASGAAFTLATPRWPLEKMQELVATLKERGQNYILISDPGIGKLNYGPYNRGAAADVFLKLNNGSEFQGVVWAGPTVFPDWFHPNTQAYWNNEFQLFFNPTDGVDIDGLWIDMNEVSNFCEYPCTDPAAQAAAQNLPIIPWYPLRLPPRPILGFPADFQPGYPEAPFRRSEVLESTETTLTALPERDGIGSTSTELLSKRANGDKLGLPGRNFTNPDYSLHVYNGNIYQKTIDTTVINANGMVQYDTHNLYGMMTGIAGQKAMISRRPKSRPFLITRSTFVGSGAYVGHWLGDNEADWFDYKNSIAGILSFASLYQLPMVGADTCGFGGTTTEELCSRWAMLGAFSPFYRNHHSGYLGNLYYYWPSTIIAAQKTIEARYKLLDYFYTALQTQSTDGTPSLNPLWFIYPSDTNTYGIQYQYFFGDAILVSPVLDEGSESVSAYMPHDVFYDLWTYQKIQGTGANIVFSNQNLSSIPVHIRGGNVVPMRISGAMTTPLLRMKDFDIVVAPGMDGTATGKLYLDDGDSIVQDATSNIILCYAGGMLKVTGSFGYNPGVNIGQTTFLGISAKPTTVKVNGVATTQWTYDSVAGVLKVQMSLPLNAPATVSYQ